MSDGLVRSLWFSDVEGSTVLLQRLGSRYTDLLVRHQAIVRSVIAARRGEEQGTEGDSFFVIFPTPTDAVAAAIDVQLAHQRERWPDDGVLRCRIGVHVGEVTDTAAGLVGLAIHHAARIAASPHGGQIVVSETVRSMCDDPLVFRDLGVYRLRDIGAVRLFQATHPDLVGEFPPLRTRRSGGKHLPTPRTSLVGRKVECDTVAGLLDEYRLVTLTGAGGSGKTRLATQVAAQTAERFEDGVWFVDLAPVVDNDGVVARIVDTLGLQADPADPVGPLLGQQVLIVMDNCEQVIDGCAVAASTILDYTDRVTILATSRQPLGIAGEVVFGVPSLSVPDRGDAASVAASAAGQLFLDRARRAAPLDPLTDVEAAAVAVLCRRLDGIPLAIELVAPLVRTMPASAIVDFLGDRLVRSARGNRGGVARHQTLYDTIDWSHQLLDPGERALFAALSVFPGDFDATAATATAGGDPDTAMVLVGLCDKSLLVTVGGGRFRLLETIREFAAERLEHTARLELRRRHATYFARLVGQHSMKSHDRPLSRLLDAVNLERDNLLAAINYLMEEAPLDAAKLANAASRALLAAELPVAAWSFAQPITEDMVARDTDVHAAWLNHRIQFRHFDLTDIDLRATVDTAAVVAELVEDPATCAELLATLDSPHYVGFKPPERATARILALADQSSDFLARYGCRLFLSNTSQNDEYLELSSQVTEIAEEAGEVELALGGRLRVAWALAESGRVGEALAIVHRDLRDVRSAVATARVEIEVLAFAIVIEGEHGDPQAASDRADELRSALTERPQSRITLAIVDAARARLRLAAGDLDGAAALAGAAIQAFGQSREVTAAHAVALLTQAAVSVERGAFADALGLVEQCLRESARPYPRALELAAAAAGALDDRVAAADLLATASAARFARGPHPPTFEQHLIDTLRSELPPGRVHESAVVARIVHALSAAATTAGSRHVVAGNA